MDETPRKTADPQLAHKTVAFFAEQRRVQQFISRGLKRRIVNLMRDLNESDATVKRLNARIDRELDHHRDLFPPT